MTLLHGCRVLDLGIITAGAATSAMLADLGAEVIKVESPTYRDPFRIWAGDGKPGEAGALPAHFRATNRNKRAISIDLKQPRGREVFLRLAARADVVVENFRRGVLGNLGLSFDALKAANPSIVLASISSQGETGPDAGHVSYGSTLEALSGLAWVTGYAGGKPEVSGRDVNYPDQIVAMFATGMISTALRSVRDGGPAVHLDLSQRDLAAFLIGDAFIGVSQGERHERRGNAQSAYPIQDCFRAADGSWIAVTVLPGDVANLAQTFPDMASADALRTILGREISLRDGRDAAPFLTGLGLRAAQVADGFGVLASQGELWSHALQKINGAIVKGYPIQVDEEPLTIHSDAPQVGEHTTEILREIGGYDVGDIEELAAAGIIERAAD